MPKFRREEKRVGLHSAVFRQLTLQAIHLRLGVRGKRLRSAKVRLTKVNGEILAKDSKQAQNQTQTKGGR
jgi:hypothetical protein